MKFCHPVHTLIWRKHSGRVRTLLRTRELLGQGRRSLAGLPPGSRRGVRDPRAASALPGSYARSGRGVIAGYSGRGSPPPPVPGHLGPGAAGVQTATWSRVWSGASASDAEREPGVAAQRVASGGGSRARPLHSGGGRGGRSSREETRWVHPIALLVQITQLICMAFCQEGPIGGSRGWKIK
ncbi:hypothetical protein R6Z07F_001634 [Ovis aries]